MTLHHLCTYIFFFFQAEDGIRDVAVTGVQTCALPISRGGARREARPHRPADPDQEQPDGRPAGEIEAGQLALIAVTKRCRRKYVSTQSWTGGSTASSRIRCTTKGSVPSRRMKPQRSRLRASRDSARVSMLSFLNPSARAVRAMACSTDAADTRASSHSTSTTLSTA